MDYSRSKGGSWLAGAALLAIASLIQGPVSAPAATSTPISSGIATGAGTAVSVLRVPDGGIQPQVAVDAQGNVHLIYFKGEPAAGDIFYVRSPDGGQTFSRPLRVNSQPGSAIALGNIRGAHLALGKAGRVHVAWMGAKGAQPETNDKSAPAPMLYSRPNDQGDAFEPQRNVMQYAVGLDGGGTLAADSQGNVYVIWHGRGSAPGEENRRVYLTRSSDDGKTFAREAPISDPTLGACACCGMRALAAKGGNVMIFFRTATKGVDRDMTLLRGPGTGTAFAATSVDRWKLSACPMTTSSLVEGAGKTLLAWETKGQIYYAGLAATTAQPDPAIQATGNGQGRKHPALAVNSDGHVLLAWTEGMSWNRGGKVCWQIYDAAGRAVRPSPGEGGEGMQTESRSIPPWSLIAAFTRPDGGFVLVY